MKKSHARIVSHTKKRTRLRVVPAHRNPNDLKKFVEAVKRLPSVDNVRTNLRTGSILVEHQGATRNQFKGVFEDISCILGSTLLRDIPTDRAKLDLPQAVADMDFRLGLLNSPFRISNLLPLSLAALTLVQMRRQGFRLAGTPWYVLAYLAYYTYTKLHTFDKVVVET